MVQTRRKDDTSFSTTHSLRRSTRETNRERVLRFEDTDKDYEEDFTSWPRRARRHPRRSCRTSIQYNSSLSRSLRSESDDDSQSDDSIFQSRRSRPVSRRHADHAETSNDHIDMAMEEDLALQEDGGVRRSSRQRNHPTSWLVGDETVRGYPSYNRNAKETTSEKVSSLRSRRSHDRHTANLPEPETQPQSSPNLHRRRSVKPEPKTAEEEDAEEEKKEGSSKEDNKVKEEKGTGAKVSDKIKEGTENQENGNVTTAEEDNAPNDECRRTRSRGKESSHLDENFPDMYSRVKRARRQTKRSATHAQSRKFASRDGEMSQTQSSSGSEDSESDQDQPTRRSSLRQSTRQSYQLRKNKPTVDRFQAHHEPPARRPPRSIQRALCNSLLRNLGRRTKNRFAPDSSSSSSDEQARFDHKKPHSRHAPHHTKDGVKIGVPHSKDAKIGNLADITPMALDSSILFRNVGGLEEHINCLQEMVVFPLLYKEVFEKFHITPPKGVLFHGPPGTGKTLIARALANECSQGDRKVSFFMRKGADCLSKWFGESERQLRLLFEQAYQMRPSIIFFDEIDGLAPVRSSKQDQIHASIVSTLLALMDGLDNRGDVIVIGATNRIDAIDPALRRPGRFDRELYFPLPACKEREEILQIHVSSWENKPDSNVLSLLAEQSSGYCGSDLRALCSESVIQALRRTYPQIYKSNKRLLLDSNKVQVPIKNLFESNLDFCVDKFKYTVCLTLNGIAQVAREDFVLAQSSIIPAAHRVTPSPAHRLPAMLEPLLKSGLNNVIKQLAEIFPHGLSREKNVIYSVHRPRLLIVGESSGQAQTTHLAPALLHHMEHIPVFTLDMGTMYEVSARSPEETVSQVFQEARRNPPSVIYLPGIGQWWDYVPQTVQSVFVMQLQKLDMNCPVFLLATSDIKFAELPAELCNIFSRYRDEIFSMSNPSSSERKDFFHSLLLEKTSVPPSPPQPTEGSWEELPEAPPPEPAKLTEEELEKLYAKEEHTLRELRIFLREVCAKLARNRLFFMFTKPVDVEEAPDYYDIIEKPMDLESMMTKIDQHHYVCAKEFLDDIDLICRNALEYNPNRDQADKLIRHRACFLRDTAYALIKAEMDTDFEDKCRTIASDRKKRKDSPSRYAPAPDFIHTLSSANIKGQTANGSKDGTTRVNGELSSHSSVASNNGVVAQVLSSRKRRPNSWSRGYISKPKKKKLSEDTCNDKQEVSEAENAANSSLALQVNSTDSAAKQASGLSDSLEKSVDEKNKLSVNGSLENTHSDLEMHEESVESKHSESGCVKETVAESEHDGKESVKTRRESDGNKEEAIGPSFSSEISHEEVLINRRELEKLLDTIVSATEDCYVETLTELYIRMEKRINNFKDKWDRTSLHLDLREELERFQKFVRSI
ncbi:ATPase family AAA domain-containing protein 2 [Frankliniella fusca]|uniref:ATPase family AAA domain-containing protein 2 n=1 Tax=Frankliniella fusca TaxID=407009 RepID=A0AAE1LUD6_9NEOP|nr:ATPase family AAA domain-containing protein 2 [Frankliniella fusca]